MSRYFSRLARKTDLIPQAHSTGLHKNASALPFTQPVEFHTDTGNNDITEKHDTVSNSTSTISVTETPALSEENLNRGASTAENTVFSFTRDTPPPISQSPHRQTEPALPTVKTAPPLQRSPIVAKNSDRPEQNSPPSIQSDKSILSENKKNTVKTPLARSESLFHSNSNKHSRPPTNESTDHNTVSSVTTDTPPGEKHLQDTLELLAHDPAHGKDMPYTSQVENTRENNRPENITPPKPARQSANTFESETLTHSSLSAQPHAKQNRQQSVRINIGQISIDIQQNPDKSPAEKILPLRQAQATGKSSGRSQPGNETRLSRYYLSGW